MKRNSESIKSKVFEKNGRWYCKETCVIEFPKWYEDKELVSIQETVYLYGIFATIIGEEYSVSTIPTLINTTPVMIREIEREGELYTQFVYGKGDCIINNTVAVKVEILSYNFFETFYMYAKPCWFMEYEDLIKTMDNLPKYAGSNVGGNFIANELTTSFIARDSKDKTKFHRQSMKNPYTYVDLMNTFYAVSSATNKLGGNYMTNGIVSAIVQKEDKPTKLEKHVRQ